MKRAIRREVWETNSSTSHSVIIMTADQAKRWENEGLYYYNKQSWYDPFDKLPEEKKPKAGEFYTQDEVIEFYKLKGYHYDSWSGDYDTDEENKDQYIREQEDFISYQSFSEDEYLENDVNYYTTPGGEEIVVLCKYGTNY